MFKTKKSEATLFRSPVRTLKREELALVSGADYEPNLAGKPSQTPIDVEGFR